MIHAIDGRASLFSTPFSPTYGILSFIRKGWAKGMYNTRHVKVQAGDVCVIPQYSIVLCEEASSDFELTTILFTNPSKIGENIKHERPIRYIIELFIIRFPLQHRKSGLW